MNDNHLLAIQAMSLFAAMYTTINMLATMFYHGLHVWFWATHQYHGKVTLSTTHFRMLAVSLAWTTFIITFLIR